MIKWTEKLIAAKDFAMAAHDSIKQVRKYSKLPYWYHVVSVAEIVSDFTTEEDVIIAAFFHDIIEDVTTVNSTTYNENSIKENFGTQVLELVRELTDVYTKEKYPHLVRAQRHNLENIRLSKISYFAQIIKLADLKNNTSDIVLNDPDFAKVYLKEKWALLKLLNNNNVTLKSEVVHQTIDNFRYLHIPVPV